MNNIPYLKTKSATILWIVKVIIGVMTLYSVYYVIKPMIPVFQEIGKQAGSFIKGIQEYIQYMLVYSGLTEELAKDLGIDVQQVSGSDLFIIISTIGLMAYFIISPILTVLDAVGATFLRLRDAGTGLIKVTHGINAVVCMLLVIDAVASIIMLILKSNLLTFALFLAYAILLAIGAITFLLMFFYHLDVVKAMTMISQNIDGGKVNMKKTHLSGLSILAGVCLALALFGAFKVDQITKQTVIEIATLLVLLIKQFMVAACYKSVKQFNQ